MNIYHLYPRDAHHRRGTVAGMVVQARDDREARKLAAAKAGDESATTWLDPAYSRCRQIGTATIAHATAHVVLRDWRAA